MEVLPAHEGETISSHKAQNKLGKQVNRVRYQRYVASLDQLPEEEGPVRTTCSGESRPEILPKPGNGARRDQALSLV